MLPAGTRRRSPSCCGGWTTRWAARRSWPWWTWARGGAGEAAELLDPAGLGGFTWLLQPAAAACEGLLGPDGRD
ncbi:hypothetical protein [Streptomyces sparsogenes]|uniref:Uncharacterized protein n=1 Tax=Streptomyces sparsogenes DSM 40356 TaxID=1331668 RepID=A0A1R1SKB0_9ACTN|nr:hypothetical protein [Streptomyces sparsogenes]OMI38479.1 hypothetical protein SPAR_15932 [Streptomyces sparsogenes DSM 40356]